jgi:hypothetical protein
VRTRQGSPSTCDATGPASFSSSAASQVLSLLALLLQKYLLYWYVRRDSGSLLQQLRGVAGAQFTRFTGTKVHILTQEKKKRCALPWRCPGKAWSSSSSCSCFTCFTGTKVQILTQHFFSSPAVHYLALSRQSMELLEVLSLLALPAQKYEY